MFDAPDLSCPAGLRDAAMLELFIATGARISELSRLELGDVCVAERQVRLLGKGSRSESSPYTRGRSRFTRGILKTEGPICFGRPRSAATRAVRCSSPTGEGR